MAACRIALLAVVATLAAGCAQWDRQGAGYQQGVVPAGGGQARAAGGPKDRYLALFGKRKVLPPPAEPQPVAFYQSTPDVFAPFDVSLHFGFFDPARMATADGVRACLEIDNVGFTVFFAVCGEYDAAQASWLLFAGTHEGSLPGSILVAGTDAEVRVETDGTTLRFHGRAYGSSTWEEVWSTPFPPQTAPLKASFGASSIRKGTEVGFDHPSFTSAPDPGMLTLERAITTDANAALLAGLAAFLSLDGASPDFPSAAVSLDLADTKLGDALTKAESLAPGKTQRKAQKLLTKGRQKLLKAAAEAAASDADGALKQLGKAGGPLEAGILLLAPQPKP